jgi:hypothetical protein
MKIKRINTVFAIQNIKNRIINRDLSVPSVLPHPYPIAGWGRVSAMALAFLKPEIR